MYGVLYAYTPEVSSPTPSSPTKNLILTKKKKKPHRSSQLHIAEQVMLSQVDSTV